MKKKNQIRGKKARASGMRFELSVRKDLEEKGWIVSKWQNNVEFTGKVDGSFEFGEGIYILESPNTAGKLEYNTFLIQGGYHLIRTFPLSGTRVKQKGIHFSLKAGFVVGLGGNKWELNGVELTDSPKAKFNQVFARLTIGGWYSKIFEKK